MTSATALSVFFQYLFFKQENNNVSSLFKNIIRLITYQDLHAGFTQNSCGTHPTDTTSNNNGIPFLLRGDVSVKNYVWK